MLHAEAGWTSGKGASLEEKQAPKEAKKEAREEKLRLKAAGQKKKSDKENSQSCHSLGGVVRNATNSASEAHSAPHQAKRRKKEKENRMKKKKEAAA